MNVKRIGAILGVKGFLMIAALTAIAVALVTYGAVVTVNPYKQLYQGVTSSSWTVYVNEVDQTRYQPGSSAEPIFNTSDSDTYGFEVVTDSSKVCAVKIDLTAAVNASKFSNFQINVKYWAGSAWADETLYSAATGSSTKNYINGLTSGDAGYVHQAASTTRYYIIEVTYSYDLVDETAQIVVNFRYTPLPQDSF